MKILRPNHQKKFKQKINFFLFLTFFSRFPKSVDLRISLASYLVDYNIYYSLAFENLAIVEEQDLNLEQRMIIHRLRISMNQSKISNKEEEEDSSRYMARSAGNARRGRLEPSQAPTRLSINLMVLISRLNTHLNALFEKTVTQYMGIWRILLDDSFPMKKFDVLIQSCCRSFDRIEHFWNQNRVLESVEYLLEEVIRHLLDKSSPKRGGGCQAVGRVLHRA